MAHPTMPRAFQHGEDRLVPCPYNPAHQVREGRLDIHISRCRKGSRRVLVSCRFNSTHLVAADALHEHLASCPDRGGSIQPSHSKYASASSEADALYPIRHVELPEPEECWDEDYQDGENRRPPNQEPGLFREHMPSGGSQGPPPRHSSTVQAAAGNNAERAHPPQQAASTSSSQPSPQPCQAGLQELPQPTTTLVPFPRPEGDFEQDDETVARIVASLGKGRRRL